MMKKLLFTPIALIAMSCSSDDDKGCNCKHAIYKHVATNEIKSFNNEPMNCATDEPIEPVKDEVWFFQECKNNPDY